MRLQQFESLRQKRSAEAAAAEAAATSTSGQAEEEAGLPRIELPPRKRKVADFLREELGSLTGNKDGAADSDEGSESEGDGDLVLDWRAKGV